MSPVLLLCGFPDPIITSIQDWCHREMPGLTILSFLQLTDFQDYMASRGVHADRGGSKPQVVFFYWASSSSPLWPWDELRKKAETGRVPVVVMAQDKSREEVLPVHQWPVSAVVAMKDDRPKEEFFAPIIQYWLRMVQLPNT